MEKRRHIAARQQPYGPPTAHCRPVTSDRIFNDLTAHAHNAGPGAQRRLSASPTSAVERRLTSPSSSPDSDDDEHSRDGVRAVIYFHHLPRSYIVESVLD